MKKSPIIGMIVLVLILFCCAGAMGEGLTGYDAKGKTWCYVTFGRYPTDADGTVQPVLWRVMKADDSQAYLMSEYILDSARIDPVRNTKWTDSELYAYLTEVMIQDMFTLEEQAALLDPEGVGLLTLPAIDDLTSSEYGLNDAKNRQCQSTEYAKRDKGKKKTLFVYQGKQKYSPYWSRTQSENHTYAFRRVMDDGKTGYMAVENAELGVRPAITLSLKYIRISSGTGTKDDPFVLESTLTAHTEANSEQAEKDEEETSEPEEEEPEEALDEALNEALEDNELPLDDSEGEETAEAGQYNEHFPQLTREGFLPQGEEEFVYIDAENGEWLYASCDLRIEIVQKTDTSKKSRPLRWLEADIYVRDGSDFMKIYYTDHEKTFKKSTNIKAVPIVNIAKTNNLVFAINADYYYYRVKRKTNIGIILRENEILYNKPASKAVTSVPNRDILALFEDATMEVYDYNEITAEQLQQAGAYDVLSFGPVLLKNGEVTAQTKTISAHQSNNPRTALGYVEKGHYVAILVEGRVSASKGCTLVELAELFIQKGCVSAYNLDGGGTASMMFMGEYLNQLGNYTADKRTQIEVLGIGQSENVAQ